MADFILTDAVLRNRTSSRDGIDSRTHPTTVDIEIRDGRIDRIVKHGEGDPDAFDSNRQFHADGRLVTPTLTEPHTHTL